MTDAARQLEFDRLKRQWWWFDPWHQGDVENQTAWAWEILRRTKAYGRFHERASALPLPPPPQRLAPGTTFRQAANPIVVLPAIYHERIRCLAVEKLTLGDRDPARTWAELFLSDDSCTLSLSWIELSSSSRRVISAQNAILPRQNKPISQYPFRVEGVILERDSGGRETAFSLERRDGLLTAVPEKLTLEPIVMHKNPDFSVLPLTLNRLGYIVIMFDTNAGESVHDLLCEWKQCVDKERGEFDGDGFPIEEIQQLADAQKPRSVKVASFKRLCRVVPSRLQYQAQAWIPAKLYHDITKLFRTILSPRESSKWLPRCRDAWTLPEEITLFGKSRTVRYRPYADTPAALKAKSAQPYFNTLKIGLAALDCRRIEREFRPSGLLIPFLRQLSRQLKDQRLTSDNGLIAVTRDSVRSIRSRLKQLDDSYSDCWRL